MSVLPVDLLADAANLDAEFRIAARLWTTTLRLEVGEEAHLVRIEDGRVLGVIPAGDDPGETRIAAPASEWRELLAPVPRPFYQDLWGALTRHGFTLDGDLERFYPYYPASRRLLELLREARARAAV